MSPVKKFYLRQLGNVILDGHELESRIIREKKKKKRIIRVSPGC